MTSQSVLQRRAVAQAFVQEINDQTRCLRCNTQPVEWHNPTHAEGRENYRISRMAARGEPIEKIRAEIAASIPLCRLCHMVADGRLERLQEANRQKPIKPAQPCVECAQLYKPLRRGLCARCNDRQRRKKTGQPALMASGHWDQAAGVWRCVGVAEGES